jgi:hypothetical protein
VEFLDYWDAYQMTAKTISDVYQASMFSGGSMAPAWVVEYVDADGLTRNYVFPPFALWLRAAEYGLDPTDCPTLLDVILHEHYITVTPDDPTFVYNTDETTARTAYLAKITQAKAGITHKDPQGLLGRITAAYPAQLDLAHYFDHQNKVAALRAARIKALNKRPGV